MHMEDYLGLPIFNQSYTVYYGASALYGTPLTLDLPEVSQNGVTINSVKYYSDASPPVLTTVAANSYFYDVTGKGRSYNTKEITNLCFDINNLFPEDVITWTDWTTPGGY